MAQTSCLYDWVFQKSLFMAVLCFWLAGTPTAKILKAEAQSLEPVPSYLGDPARKSKSALYLFICFYFQLNKLLTFNRRVLLFLAWLLNSGDTRLLVPGEPLCTACWKCGSELQKPKWDLPFFSQDREISEVLHFSAQIPTPPPPKTVQMTHINLLGLVANIPNASEEMWPLWVPNFALKSHGQMSVINILALKLVCCPAQNTEYSDSFTKSTLV